MVAASILPIAWHKGEWRVLFGKESAMETSAKGWSDFGGRVDDYDRRESSLQCSYRILHAAAREGMEESTAFLGTQDHILERLCAYGRRFSGAAALVPRRETADHLRALFHSGVDPVRDWDCLVHESYHVFFYPVEYHSVPVDIFNDNHALIWRTSQIDARALQRSKLFEKSEMYWFSLDDIRTHRDAFRPFYRTIAVRIADTLQLRGGLRPPLMIPPASRNGGRSEGELN